MTPVVGIRANAGAAVGFGHVRRCVSLAEALLERGAEVVFFANPESEPTTWLPRQGSRRAQVEVVPASEAATLTITNARALVMNVRALVVDSYDTGADALAQAPVPVAAIIDAAPSRPLPAALIVNSAADAASVPHPLARGARALLGPEFAMLRSEFTRQEPRQVRANISSVLVMAGGGDPTGLSLVFVDGVRAVLEKALITVVIGPYFTDLVVAALRTRAAADPLVTLAQNPASIRDLMVAADVALTAGGQTTYELAAVGVPACAVRVALNQTGNLEGLSARKAILWVGDAGDHDVQLNLQQALRQLSTDTTLRQSMSQAGQISVDGLGAARVAAAVLELCA